MARRLLIASNDPLTRGISAKFFESHGFSCRCVSCDECLISHIRTFDPDVLITEATLHSRFFLSHDVESTMSFIQAARLTAPKLSVIVINSEDSPEARAYAKLLGLVGFYSYPLDLCGMLEAIRAEFRRISRLRIANSLVPGGLRKRGRPRKYLPSPPFAPFQPVSAFQAGADA